MPFYEITTEGEEAKRLIKAESAAAAVRFCAKGKFQARTISNVDEAAALFTAGVKVEDASAEPESDQPPPNQVKPNDGGDGADGGTPPGKPGKAPPAKED